MYALTITVSRPSAEVAWPDAFNMELREYLEMKYGGDKSFMTLMQRSEDDLVGTTVRNSANIAVLQGLAAELQDPSSNLYVRHGWALANNVTITYDITEVPDPQP